jgi:23S rRNA pseudouridine1911/1915/1917 synthase
MGTPRSLSVPREQRGRTVEDFLRRMLPAATPARVEQLLRDGAVTLKGKPVRAGRKLWGGEQLQVSSGPPVGTPRAVHGPVVPVLAETRDVLLVDKPAGWSVEPEPGQVSLVELLAHQRPGFDVGGTPLPGVVQRLDRNTTGVLAVARTDEGFDALRRAFDDGRVEKDYLAVVLGAPPAEGRFDTPYARDPSHARRYTTRLPSARRATLSWKVREQLAGTALVEVRLETGRTHQVRCQFADAGFPVLGDSLYGGEAALAPAAAGGLGRQALHAWRLHLALESGEVTAESPLPADVSSLLAGLRAGA